MSDSDDMAHTEVIKMMHERHQDLEQQLRRAQATNDKLLEQEAQTKADIDALRTRVKGLEDSMSATEDLRRIPVPKLIRVLLEFLASGRVLRSARGRRTDRVSLPAGYAGRLLLDRSPQRPRVGSTIWTSCRWAATTGMESTSR